MIFVWLIAGCAIVTLGFFLPGPSAELWPNINSAGSALAAYIVVVLIAFVRRTDISRIRRIIVLVCGVATIGLTSFTWTSVQDQTQWQAKTLGEIGSTISRGVYNVALSDSLLDVLEAYHRQGRRPATSLGQIYREMYPSALPGDSMSTLADVHHEPGSKPTSSPADIFVVEVSDDRIVWAARHPWYVGADPDFVNIDDRRGVVQVRATLTAKGLQYVTEN